MRQIWHLSLLLVFVLTACANDEASAPAQTAVSAAGDVVRGDELPGRLLFVRDGVVWQWQGREARPLLGTGEAVQPTWSPEGQRIAYVARSNSASDLLIADAEGQVLAQLTENTGDAPPNSFERMYNSRWVFYPAWTPTGGSLVVATQLLAPVGDPPEEYQLGLALISTAPGEQVPLYAAERAHVGRSAVNPDGKSLVFTHAGTGSDGEQALYILDLAASAAQPMPGATVPGYDPAFSPDGAWLAYAGDDGNGTDIFALPAGGGAPLRLTKQGSARAPAFSPDGTMLVFFAIAPGEAGFDLWSTVLDTDETGTLTAAEPRRLTTGLGLDADSGVSWAP